jgi:hypothetical protein
MIKRLALSALLIATIAAPARAADNDTVRFRGTVTALETDSITIQSSAGQNTKVKLADDYKVLQFSPIVLADIKPNAYLAAASIPQSDGSFRALSVSVFPEAMRGANEGSTAWDLKPGSRMTNATAGEIVAKPEGRVITLTFQGKAQKLLVPEHAPVTAISPVDKESVKIGAKAVVFGMRDPAGGVTSGLVAVTKDGALPPI